MSRSKKILACAITAAVGIAGSAGDAGAGIPNDARRFAQRTYVSAGRTVVVEAAADLLVVRTRRPLDRQSVARLAADALVRVARKDPAAAAVRIGAVNLLQRHGLFLIELPALESRELLLRLVDELQGSDRVRQVYPVLKRGPGRAFYDDQLALTALPGQLGNALEKALPLLEARLLRVCRVPDTALLQIGARFSFDAVEASRWLAARGGIPGLVSAEPHLYRERRPTRIVDDPVAARQWHLFRSAETLDPNLPGVGQIFAPRAWDLTLGDPAVIIAIADTGIDVDHPDLAPNIVPGFDAVDGDDDPRPECSRSYDGAGESATCVAADPDRPFRESHGTATAGLAAGRGDNGLGASGVCPLCSVMPIRLLGTGDATGDMTTADVFVEAVDRGAAIISNSWGMWSARYFPQSQAERDAFRYARLQGRRGLGTLILFAAGNETSDVASDANARSTDAMAIAASTNLDDWAYYSNYGEAIDVAAPSIGGADPEGSDSYGIVTHDVSGADGYSGDDYTSDFGGTSASCPIAAGAAGLVLSVAPDLTADQVRIAVTSTADKIHADKLDWPSIIDADVDTIFAYDEIGHSIGFGWGRIDVGQAMMAALLPSLQGALCTAAGCEDCDPDGRCRLICHQQGDCPDGSVCRDGRCDTPRPEPGTAGTDCTADCVDCVWTVDANYEPVELCTEICSADDDCPTGWDCRLLTDGETRVCVIGNPHAGEPAGNRNCRSDLLFSSVVALGEDGQAYCSEVCFANGEDECPYGFHCSAALCSCTSSGGWGCSEYTCHETPIYDPDIWPFRQCFPDAGFGITCQRPEDCGLGAYCNSDGNCRIDDRTGCLACAPCETADDCGPVAACLDLQDGSQPRCAIPCRVNDSCPGDAICREVTYIIRDRERTQRLCVSPDTGPEGEWCDPGYVCQVACRDDVPCPAGQVCDQGVCVLAPTPAGDGGATASSLEGGCGCGARATAWTMEWIWLLAGLVLPRLLRSRHGRQGRAR
ncbi:MAG: S8 family serine peptidase [Deltaproteobacteria bacterium]|nr:S8 family serine peptidase [Deltaproteobacteria bacterium]